MSHTQHPPEVSHLPTQLARTAMHLIGKPEDEWLGMLCLDPCGQILACHLIACAPHVIGRDCTMTPAQLDLRVALAHGVPPETHSLVTIRYHPHRWFVPGHDPVTLFRQWIAAAEARGLTFRDHVVADAYGTVYSFVDDSDVEPESCRR